MLQLVQQDEHPDYEGAQGQQIRAVKQTKQNAMDPFRQNRLSRVSIRGPAGHECSRVAPNTNHPPAGSGKEILDLPAARRMGRW